MPPRRRQPDPSSLPRRGRATAAVAGVIAALALLAHGPDSRASDPCTISWDGGAGTSRWADDANWTGDRQPGAADVVCIGGGSDVSFGGLRTTVARLRVGGSLTLAPSDLQVAGPGESEVTGSLTLAGGRFELNADLTAASFRHSSGIVFGTGAVRTPDFRWTGGSEHGSGSTEVVPGGPGLALSGASHTLDQTRTLRIDAGATATWTAGDLELNDHAVIDNSGLLDVRGDQDLIGCCGIAPAVVNEPGATLRKSEGGDTTRIGYPLVNDGAIDVRSGTLSLGGGSVRGRESIGSFEVEDGATLLFTSGPNALGPSSTVVSHGSGQVRLTGGQTFFTGTVDASVTVDAPAAYAFFESAVSLPHLRLARGFLAGGGTVSTPDFEWTGGNQIGSGSTRVVPGGAGLAIAGDAPHVLEDRRLEIESGATAVLTAGDVALFSSARIENAGLFDVRADVALAGSCCGGGTLVHNDLGGTFRKSAGDGRATVGYRFRNDGTIEAESGTLDLAGGLDSFSDGTLGGGRYVVRGTLAFSGAHVTSNAATLELRGPGSRIEDTGGADALRDLAWNAPEAELTLSEGRTLSPSGPLANAGTVTLGEGAALAPAASYTQSIGVTDLSGPGAVLRAGTRVELAGGLLRGSGTVDATLVNGATVAPGSDPGALTVSGDYVQTSAGTLRTEVAAPERHSRLDVAGTARLAGTLAVETPGSYVPDPADEIELIRHGGEQGEFDDVQGLDANPAHPYPPPDYAPDAVWLRAGAVPSVSIGDAAATEGDTGDATATFEVSVAPTPTRTVRVAWRTLDGTAVAPGDYAAASGTVTIPHGRSTAEIQVPVHGDATHEPDESFTLELSSPAGATLGRDRGTATVFDDDPAPPPVEPPVEPPPVKPPIKPPIKPPVKPPHPKPKPKPKPRPRPRPCRDRLAPSSRLDRGRRGLRVSHRRLSLRGTARDNGCAGLRAVSVAVALHTHHRCRFLKRNGRLGKRVRCRRIAWIPARGTRKWRLDPQRRLPRGRYTIQSRATDKKGNKEKRPALNARTLRIR